MGRKRCESESPPLPPIEYMSHNRRAMFGDPPSAYMAAVIARCEREQRKKREQARLENEQKSQNEEELPRKRRDSVKETDSYLTPAENDHLVWPGSGASVTKAYHSSGTSQSHFGDSESNGESDERSEVDSVGQANDGSEGSGEDLQHSEDSEYREDQSEEGTEADSEDHDNENVLLRGKVQHSSQTTASEEDDEEEDTGKVSEAQNKNDILVNKALCAPCPMQLDDASSPANLLLPSSNIVFHNNQTQHLPADPVTFAISNQSSPDMFSVPGTIFVDPIDFDDDRARSFAHSLARHCATLGSQNDSVVGNENIPPAHATFQNESPRSVPDVYNPVAENENVGSPGHALPALYEISAGMAFSIDPESNMEATANWTHPFYDEDGHGSVYHPSEFSELNYQELYW
ncbi:hypothetical protein AJ79_00851 [Helicocarpus griseus UAMH5409]|uniref:Uncharacterized protein n=1 Tax=Helicocarpus griseus UAMH5409 TaxID=1447875 RepID=A0A2B7YAQ8_9EURO|nr:hypothetical protein AJ79_00851 [Helicocarpus griseus UAMH5409]